MPFKLIRSSIFFFLFIFIFNISTLFAFETKTLTSEFTGENFNVSILNEEELGKLFEYLSTRSNIPFHVVQDGCFGRAYLMITAAGLKNISLAKRVFETRNNGVILIPSEDNKWRLRWYYHVAPLVYLRLESGEVVERVIDPSLFNHPVSKEEFLDKLLSNSPGVEVDSFILPKFITAKDQFIQNINLRKLDQTMAASMSEVMSRHNKYGVYHEKAPLYDSKALKWFQGGWEVTGLKPPTSSL